jgi:interleukin-1 receptor-associated kinase 1
MMTIDQLENQKDTSSNIVFTIAPAEDIREICHYDLAFDPPISRRGTSTIDGRNVTVKISTETSMLVVKIHIDLQGNSSVASKYIRVWIDYDNPYNASLSLFVDSGEGTQKPANAVVSTNIFTPIYTIYQASFGFISSMGQLLQLHTFNSTISSTDDRLLLDCPIEGTGYPDSYDQTHAGPDSQGKQTIILASLGSAAATAITAAVVYFYFNSKYRRWKLEQEKLTKTMQRLPGVPTHVDYAVIRRATRNFHETMRLGKGGFGAVFRCTLPATASRTGSIQEVAVKKFLREVEDRRYNDFMAEVSIINRLRHKNIVPLVGEYLYKLTLIFNL